MFRSESISTHPVCTVRRHPDGGFAPVLHLSDQPCPSVSPHCASLPSVGDVMRYVRTHHGLLAVRVHEECAGASAA